MDCIAAGKYLRKGVPAIICDFVSSKSERHDPIIEKEQEKLLFYAISITKIEKGVNVKKGTFLRVKVPFFHLFFLLQENILLPGLFKHEVLYSFL